MNILTNQLSANQVTRINPEKLTTALRGAESISVKAQADSVTISSAAKKLLSGTLSQTSAVLRDSGTSVLSSRQPEKNDGQATTESKAAKEFREKHQELMDKLEEERKKRAAGRRDEDLPVPGPVVPILQQPGNAVTLGGDDESGIIVSGGKVSAAGQGSGMQPQVAAQHLSVGAFYKLSGEVTLGDDTSGAIGSSGGKGGKVSSIGMISLQLNRLSTSLNIGAARTMDDSSGAIGSSTRSIGTLNAGLNVGEAKTLDDSSGAIGSSTMSIGTLNAGLDVGEAKTLDDPSGVIVSTGGNGGKAASIDTGLTLLRRSYPGAFGIKG